MTSPHRTYSHLESLGHKPSDYEIATSKLLYYPERGFEVWTPLADWYERHQRGSSLKLNGTIDGFRDPRETTYGKYVALQAAQESFIDRLFDQAESSGYDERLAPAWLDRLEAVLPLLRFPMHGLEMVAAYAGSMAPEGRVVITFALQAADELRRIERIAYRCQVLGRIRPAFRDARASKARWCEDPRWQPLRRAIERLFVTFDWGEAFVATNLVLKPAFDEIFMVHFANVAERRGDHLLASLFASFAADSRWQHTWSATLARELVRASPDAASVIRNWLDRWWLDHAAPIADSFGPLLSESSDLVGSVRLRCETLWANAGVST